MESPIYGELNRANQCHDKSLIQTLGPYALLLNGALDTKSKNTPLEES